MWKGVEAAGHEEQGKNPTFFFPLEEPVQQSRCVKSCLNDACGETNYNPQELKDQRDLAEVAYFKSGAPSPHAKGIV